MMPVDVGVDLRDIVGRLRGSPASIGSARIDLRNIGRNLRNIQTGSVHM
jgi:hypothetical protein